MELHALQAMVKVTVGKAEDPWCEIDLTEEDVEDSDDFKGFGFGILCLQDLVAQRSGCASWMHEGSFRRDFVVAGFPKHLGAVMLSLACPCCARKSSTRRAGCPNAHSESVRTESGWES